MCLHFKKCNVDFSSSHILVGLVLFVFTIDKRIKAWLFFGTKSYSALTHYLMFLSCWIKVCKFSPNINVLSWLIFLPRVFTHKSKKDSSFTFTKKSERENSYVNYLINYLKCKGDFFKSVDILSHFTLSVIYNEEFRGVDILILILIHCFVVHNFRSALFSTLTDDGSGCIDCVGTTDTLAAFNMTTNVSVFLPTIYYLFPNLQHLTFNSLPANTSEQVKILLFVSKASKNIF